MRKRVRQSTTPPSLWLLLACLLWPPPPALPLAPGLGAPLLLLLLLLLPLLAAPLLLGNGRLRYICCRWCVYVAVIREMGARVPNTPAPAQSA